MGCGINMENRMKRKLYQHIASRLQAMENCDKSGNAEWLDRHERALHVLCRDYLPRGSGFDNGTTLMEGSKPNRLVFITAYHHMNEGGYYDGWTNHTVIITPDLASGFNVRVTGRDRNDIKDYVGDSFHEALSQEIDDADIAEIANAA